MYSKTLQNKIFKILAIKEQNGNWQPYCQNVVLTLMQETEVSEEAWILIGRLESLKFLNDTYFRKTILDLVNLPVWVD